MWKRSLLIPLALFFLWVSELNVCWEVSIDRHSVPGFFSRRQINSCMNAAERAAGELLREDTQLPVLEKSCRLRLSAPDGDMRLLTHRLLLETEGIVSADAVYANGTAIGTVESGQELFRRLREYIKNQMPNAAVMGGISGKISICPVYSISGNETDYGDMLLLISGIAPVFYLDSSGRLA